MIPRDLPEYVDCGGSQVWRPPYTARGVETFGFVLPCKREAIDALLRRELVEPAGGAVDYRCAQEWMVILFTRIEHLASAEQPDKLRGYASELEVSVWCLAADVLAEERLVWYLPYVFVDSGSAMASGREVYGYPKQLGVFEPGFPKGLEDAKDPTAVEAMAIKTYGADAGAKLEKMISAERLSTVGEDDEGKVSYPELRSLLTDGLHVAKELPFGPGPALSGAITSLGAPLPQQSILGVPAWAARRVLDTLSGRSLVRSPGDLIAEMVDNPTLVFLKQFRDVSCSTKACYQAIVEAPLAIRPALGATSYEALDCTQYQLEIWNYDSHPIASELGVPAGTALTPKAAFRASFEFDIMLGLEVWRAPT